MTAYMIAEKLRQSINKTTRRKQFQTIEFLGNSLTQTNKTKQTKQKFIRLYYLDCWIHVVPFDEQKKV